MVKHMLLAGAFLFMAMVAQAAEPSVPSAAPIAVAAPAAPLPAAGATYWDLMQNGLEINLTLCAMAFASLFLFFLTVLATRRARIVPKRLLLEISADIREGLFDAAREKAERDESLLASVILPAIKLHDQPLERIHQLTEGAGRRAVGALRQRAAYISNLAVLCPMLGLLGTVMGMTEAFQVYSSEVNAIVHQKLLMGAIAKAMITTLVGLIVAIPAMAMYYFAIGCVNRAADELETAAEDVIAFIGERQ